MIQALEAVDDVAVPDLTPGIRADQVEPGLPLAQCCHVGLKLVTDRLR